MASVPTSPAHHCHISKEKAESVRLFHANDWPILLNVCFSWVMIPHFASKASQFFCSTLLWYSLPRQVLYDQRTQNGFLLAEVPSMGLHGQ